MYNTLIRFALSRQLNVLFPRHGHMLSQNRPSFSSHLPHPPSPPFFFDIFCNHVVYNRHQVDRYFPRDTKHLAILRHPWKQVQSAFHYYSTVFSVPYLKRVPSFETFVRNQRRFEPSNPLKSMTNNRMSVDLGLPGHLVSNVAYVPTFLANLNKTFDLMLIADHYDESMVLLRRMFNWTTKDILYLKVNVLKAKKNKTSEPYPELKKQFEYFQVFDYAVYNHYLKVFQQTIVDQGKDFQTELKHYLDVETQVSQFCQTKSSETELHVAESKWNEDFVLTREECRTMGEKETTINEWAKSKQLARLAPDIYNPNSRSGLS